MCCLGLCLLDRSDGHFPGVGGGGPSAIRKIAEVHPPLSIHWSSFSPQSSVLEGTSYSPLNSLFLPHLFYSFGNSPADRFCLSVAACVLRQSIFCSKRAVGAARPADVSVVAPPKKRIPPPTAPLPSSPGSPLFFPSFTQHPGGSASSAGSKWDGGCLHGNVCKVLAGGGLDTGCLAQIFGPNLQFSRSSDLFGVGPISLFSGLAQPILIRGLGASCHPTVQRGVLTPASLHICLSLYATHGEANSICVA